jgi:hypothetical protein
MTATHTSIGRREASHLLPPVAMTRDAGAKPTTSGKRKREKQSLPSIRTTTSDGSLEVLKVRLVGHVIRKPTPFISAKTLLKMRNRRFAIQGNSAKNCCYDVQIRGKGSSFC